MKKDLAIVGGLFLLLAALIIFGKGFTTGGLVSNPNREATGSSQPLLNPGSLQSKKDRVDVSIKNFKVAAMVADSRDERKKGLSDRDELPISEGMLFVFEENGQWGIWMKDMRFPIDIIWIDNSKKIVDIAQNVLPEPDRRDEELKIYHPQSEAKYILEINSGLVNLNELEIGDQVSFEL